MTKGSDKAPSKGPQSSPIRSTNAGRPTGRLGAPKEVSGTQKPGK